ncbi:MAG: hypothetical protein NTV02_03365 [Candidatus Zambryskibacteria bacterium]|nr:hypothetical protein [Candidatus Zambryskibacteria bacterium]
MKINFFEEYPTQENMTKLDLVDWPATILVAAPSLTEFESIQLTYTQKYPHIIFGWWPTVAGSYWVSGFTNPSDLDRLFGEITSKKQPHELPILMDLELPLKKSLYIRNFFNIRKNKNKIAEFFNQAPNYNLKIYTAEYSTLNNLFLKLWHFFGISPSFSFQHTKLVMCYSSMAVQPFEKSILLKVKRFEKNFAQSNQSRVGFGLGTIATGVLGNEPILSPEDLSKDLRWAKESNVEEVFIFRLGGLNESYIGAIKENINNIDNISNFS